MEDQQAGSGDLTTPDPSVPQGKTTRSRHRLPRGKAKLDAQADDTSPAEETPAVDEAEVEETPVVEETQAAVVEEPVVEEPVVVEQPAVEEAPAPEEPAAEPSPEIEPDADAEARSETSKADEAEAEAGDTDTEDEAEPAEVVLVPHRPAGRVLKAAALVAAVLFVAAAAFSGFTAHQYLSDRAVVHIKVDVARTAADAITTLWTYTPDDMDQLPQRSSQYLSGDFAADYKRYIDAIVAPNKQAQVTNQTQVLGAAVESLTANDATAIVYTNSIATSPVTKGIPSLRYLSYRLAMKRDARRWLITEMVAITKLDLTPRV